MIKELYQVEKIQGQEPLNYRETNLKNLYIKARTYFLSMREQHRELIKKTIDKYSENYNFERLVFALNLVLGPITNYQVPNLRSRVLFLIKALIRQTVQQELSNMPRNERIRYQKTSQHIAYLMTQVKRKLEHEGKISYEISFLLYQDILSLLLLQSQLFEKACDSSNPLFYGDDLSELLVVFNKEDVKKFAKYFSKILPYLTFERISKKFVQIVKILIIIILRFRVINIASKIPNYSLLNPTSDLLLKSRQESQYKTKGSISPYGYYLSEVSIFMYLRQIIHFSPCINGLFLHLKEAVKEKTIEQRKWMLLKTKIKYNVSFKKLFHFFKKIEQDAQDEIHQMSRDLRQPAMYFYKFFQALPYIFLKNESYFQAFQKRGFNQEFDITHVAEGVFKCSPYLKGLMLMSVYIQYATYGLNMAKLIKLQKLYAKVLVIKKYEFSYNEMRSSFGIPSEKDIPITLILGTIEDRLLFCQVAFRNLQESQYIKSIQKLLLQHKLSQPYVILIQAYHDYTPFSRSSFASLLKIAKKLKTRLYISYLGEEKDNNIFLFAYIYSRMFKKSACCQKDFSQYFSSELDFQVNKIRKWQNQKYEKALQSQSQF